MDQLEALRAITKKAVAEEGGCEWVKSKSMQAIGAYTLEETYELLDALEHKDSQAIKEELADLAFHLLLYAEKAEQAGEFTLEDVLATALEKQQTRRLQADSTPTSAAAAHAHWVAQKNKSRDRTQSILADVPANMSALVRSQKIQDRVASVHFDWNNVADIIDKLHEEIEELQVEIRAQKQEAILDELGDVLFTTVNIARHCDIDAEQALRYANNKFLRRFQYLEQLLAAEGLIIENMDFKALLEVWEIAKNNT